MSTLMGLARRRPFDMSIWLAGGYHVRVRRRRLTTKSPRARISAKEIEWRTDCGAEGFSESPDVSRRLPILARPPPPTLPQRPPLLILIGIAHMTRNVCRRAELETVTVQVWSALRALSTLVYDEPGCASTGLFAPSLLEHMSLAIRSELTQVHSRAASRIQ